MSSADRQGVLRERNKDLLNQLNQQREKLERLGGCRQSRKREREDGAEERREPAEVLTLTGGDPGPARAALARPTVRFAGGGVSGFTGGAFNAGMQGFMDVPGAAPQASTLRCSGGGNNDTCDIQTGIQRATSTPSLTSQQRAETADRTTQSELLTDSSRHPPDHSRLQDTRPASTKSCPVNHSKEPRETRSRVTFQSDECEETSASDRHHLLGYDWIAGVLDAEDSLIERSDEFFNDLRTFRSLNKDECVHSPQAEVPEEKRSVLPLLTDKDGPEANTDTHQCTFSYRINSRLFPVPLHSQECCPVCKEHKSSRPHTMAEPALIRVSIPRSTLLPPYKYKAHRRCSFDPSDSLGLPSHCLSGWSNTGQKMLPPPSNLDLRSGLNMKSSTEAQNRELEDLSAAGKTSDQLSDVSRLARHNFQHFSSKRKLGSTFHPLH